VKDHQSARLHGRVAETVLARDPSDRFVVTGCARIGELLANFLRDARNRAQFPGVRTVRIFRGDVAKAQRRIFSRGERFGVFFS